MGKKWCECINDLFEAISFYEVETYRREALEEIQYQFNNNSEKIRLFYEYEANEEQKKLIDKAKKIINFGEW